MDKKTIDTKNTGVRTEKLILALLRQHTQLSQSQICEMANLGSSTVCYIVGRLREKGLIIEKQGQSLKRGPKPVAVSINPRGQFVVGVEINPDNILIGLFDFNCRLIETTQVLLSDDRSPENIGNTLEINLRGLLGKHRIEHKKLSGVGVVLSGSISRDGIVELSSPLGWKSVPLRQMLIDRLKVPVMVCTTRVRLLAENSKAHDIHYFFYVGGNDSMDTADKVNKLAKETGYELVCMGVPKTIDNDLACTDHCPGYGSVAKYVATSAMSAGKDTEALYTTDTCTILEVMGRNAGWIAAATGLARREPQDAPHLIYMPEAAFCFEKLLNDVKEVHKQFGRDLCQRLEGVHT